MTPRIAWIALGVVVLACAVWVALLPSERAYHDKVAELRAAGQAVDFDGLAPPLGPADENGAQAFLDAYAWIRKDDSDEERSKPVGPWNVPDEGDWADVATPEDLAKHAAYLDGRKPYFDLLRAAAAKPRLQFRSEKRDVYGYPDDHHDAAGFEAGRFLEAAGVAARTPAERLDAVATQLALAVRLERVSLLDEMIASTLASSATRSLRQGVESGAFDAATARARLDRDLRAEWLRCMPQMLREQRAIVVQIYRATMAGEGQWAERRSWIERLRDRLTNKRGASSGTPTSFEPADAAAVVAEIDAMTRGAAVPASSYATYRRAVLAAVGDPPSHEGVENLVRTFATVDAQSRLARVALAVAERRTASGAYPASLDELKDVFPDGMPLDPFTDAPFVYETTPTGVRIACVPDKPSPDVRAEWRLKR